MSDIIKKYYEENSIPASVLEQRMKAFARHDDISAEFENWIVNGVYKEDSAICVEGYTAKALSELSQLLNGEGAFQMLIELRENPRRAQKRLAEGFVRK